MVWGGGGGERGGGGGGRRREDEVVLGELVTSLLMLPGHSAGDQKPGCPGGDSRGNVGGSWREAVTKLSCARWMGHELVHVNRWYLRLI